MKECPVCKDGKKYTNQGVHIHIGRMAQTDPAHKAYRDQEPGAEVDPLDLLLQDLQPKAEPVPEPVYKETSAPKTKIVLKRLVKQTKTAEPEVEEKKRIQNVRDTERKLEMITRMPILVLIFAVLYKATTDLRFFTGWLDSDFGELYGYVLTNPSNGASIIILTITVVAGVMIALVLHKIVWRFLFKDLQIRYIRKDPKTGRFIAVGTSMQGRLFLTIGHGFLDRLYRKITKAPQPDVITFYFKRRGFVNPFRVLASCEKGYLREDPAGTQRTVTEGLFKRTLIATHLRRDTEDDSTVYWFETGPYEPKLFDSEWYRLSHMGEIKLGLAKVSKACGMDSAVQKDQMRNVASWLSSDMIAEDKRIYDLKREKMGSKVER